MKLTKLSPEQIAKFADYADKWVKIGTDTNETDMISAVLYIKEAYQAAGLNPPSYFVGPVAGPYEAAVAESIVNSHAKKKTVFSSASDFNDRIMREVEEYIEKGSKDFNYTISNQIFGYQEYWLSYYDYFAVECGIDLQKIDPLIKLASVCGWWTPLTDVAIIQHKPSLIARDDRNRLHSTEGPAVRFRSKSQSLSDVYCVHGVRVNKKIIDRDFKTKDIDNQKNVEVRRVMIDLYGKDKYIIDSGAEIVHQDDFGTLYRKEMLDDEPLMMVKVVNSTVEPDGTFKDYFIRVDEKCYGGLKTARAAVASTWRNNDAERSLVFKNPEDYDPDIET